MVNDRSLLALQSATNTTFFEDRNVLQISDNTVWHFSCLYTSLSRFDRRILTWNLEYRSQRLHFFHSSSER